MSGKIGSIFGIQPSSRDDVAPGDDNGALHNLEDDMVSASPDTDHGYNSSTGPIEEPVGEARTVLGAGCSFDGKLVCTGPTRLDGDFKGEIQADDLVIIGEHATVTADLNVQELIVSGIVRGNITSVRRVSLAPSAHIEGDIQTPSLTIKEGAQVKGRVDVAPGGRDKSGAVTQRTHSRATEEAF